MNCIKTNLTNKCFNDFDIKWDQPIGSGAYGTTYKACCSEDCNYVIKWLENYKSNPEDEIEYQQLASEIGVALPIHEIIRCTDKKIGWVMERLDKTVYEELLGISEYHDDLITYITPLIQSYDSYCKIIKKNKLTKKLIELITTINENKFKLDKLNRFNLLYKNIQSFFRLGFKKFPEIPIPQHKLPIIKLKETMEQKHHKTKVVAEVILLLRKLHTIGIAHTDTQGSNFMSKDGKYYIIDFGQARKLLTEKEKRKQNIEDDCTAEDDFNLFINEIKYYLRNYEEKDE